MSKYKWVYHDGATLYEVGILSDGTLHNPRGYPDDAVRTAVMAADARQHERRSSAAKKAAHTRSVRQQRQVYRIAERMVGGGRIGPRITCAICGRSLDDAQSVDRGIGSECWQGVMSIISQQCD